MLFLQHRTEKSRFFLRRSPIVYTLSHQFTSSIRLLQGENHVTGNNSGKILRKTEPHPRYAGMWQGVVFGGEENQKDL